MSDFRAEFRAKVSRGISREGFDNAFQKEFEGQMRNWAQSKGVQIRVRRGQGYVSDSQSRVENANREWRAATRKMLMSQKVNAKNWYANGVWRRGHLQRVHACRP